MTAGNQEHLVFQRDPGFHFSKELTLELSFFELIISYPYSQDSALIAFPGSSGESVFWKKTDCCFHAFRI